MILMPNGLSPQKVEDLTAQEMAWLAMGEDVLRKMNLTLACPRCLAAGLKTGAVLHGANDATDHTLSVQCGCRRLTYRAKAA
jgi:hypothetical protein